jgi:hypothetical protein
MTETHPCVICFCETTNTWNGLPNMYCETCEPIREAARGVVSHVIDTLYLSDMQAAKSFDGFRMCVHESGPEYDGQCHFIPILETRPNSSLDRSGAVASIKMLNEAADLIHQHVSNQEKLLVHCQGGVERSPLTIAWYLVNKAKRFSTLDQAYVFLKQKRPVVSPRLFWLPSHD